MTLECSFQCSPSVRFQAALNAWEPRFADGMGEKERGSLAGNEFSSCSSSLRSLSSSVCRWNQRPQPSPVMTFMNSPLLRQSRQVCETVRISENEAAFVPSLVDDGMQTMSGRYFATMRPLTQGPRGGVSETRRSRR